MSNGKEFDLWVSSKAPMNEFGNIPKSTVTAIVGDNSLGNMINKNIDNDMAVYHGDGDDAKFTPDETESSRLFMYMHIDTDKGTVKDTIVSSFGTENLITHEHTMANPVSFSKIEKGMSEYSSSVLGFGYQGSNPDVPNAPAIDIQGQLRFTDQKNGDLLVQGEVYGDGFPATSMFAHFGDTKLMIASSPIPKGGTVWDLAGSADKRIMNINQSIEFKDDIPVAVKDWNTMKEYSVEDWNKLHESTPMIESEDSKEMVIDKGEPISQVEVEKDMLASYSGIEINLNEEVTIEEENTLPPSISNHLAEIESNFNTNDMDNAMDLA